MEEKLRDCESDDHHSMHLMQATKPQSDSSMTNDRSNSLEASCFTQSWRPDVQLTPSSQVKDLVYDRSVQSPESLPMDLLEYVCLSYMSQTLTWLEQGDNLQYARSGHWKLYMQWIRRCLDEHPSFDSKDLVAEANLKAARDEIASSESGSVVLTMIDVIGKNLRQIFMRETETLQLMVEGDLHRFYRSAFGISANRNIAEFIGLLADKNQGLSVLEIGGGSGGTTYNVLERLRNADGTSKAAKYRFTDVSPGFLAKAADKFSRDAAIMEFSKWNSS